MFDRKWADWLGIQVEDGPRRTFRGLMGSFYAYEHEVTINTLGIEFTSRVYFTAELNVARDLLGHKGWLEHFRVAMVHYDRELYLSPYDA